MVEVSNRADLIERKIDRTLADNITVSRETGGVDIHKLGEVMEAAKLMALAGSMIPKFLQENPGGCFGILWKAYAWGMDPFAVAEMAYEVENRRTKERRVSYMSQLIHAIIENRAPLQKRLEVRYEGEGDDRVCICSGLLIGETEPREHKSPRLGDRKPKPRGRDSRDPRDESGMVDDDDKGPGSPLWRTKPDVQLWYDTSRDWARIYCPDVILGLYDPKEMAAVGFTPAPPKPAAPTPSDDGGLATRLTASALARAGFPAQAAVAAVDAEMAKRDIGAAFPDNPLSVGQSADAAYAPPQEDGAAAATGEPPEASEADAATPAPETSESRPRTSRGRRSGRPPETDEQRLV